MRGSGRGGGVRLLSPQPQVVLVVAFCNFPGCAHLTTTWPSGLRRAVQVRVSQGAWFRYPPSSSFFPFCLPPFPFPSSLFPLCSLSPFCPFPAGLSPIPAAFFLAFQNFTLLERAFSRPFRGPKRDEGVPVLHTLLLLSRCAQALARCSTSRQVPVRKRKERAKETSLRVRRTSLGP